MSIWSSTTIFICYIISFGDIPVDIFVIHSAFEEPYVIPKNSTKILTLTMKKKHISEKSTVLCILIQLIAINGNVPQCEITT